MRHLDSNICLAIQFECSLFMALLLVSCWLLVSFGMRVLGERVPRARAVAVLGVVVVELSWVIAAERGAHGEVGRAARLLCAHHGAGRRRRRRRWRRRQVGVPGDPGERAVA